MPIIVISCLVSALKNGTYDTLKIMIYKKKKIKSQYERTS